MKEQKNTEIERGEKDMWKVGSKWKLEYFDYEEIRERIQRGEHPADVAEEYHTSEFEVRRIAGVLDA